MIGTDKNNFPNNLLLTNRKVVSLRKVFRNSSSKDIKLSKTQLSKIIELGGFVGGVLGPSMKFGLLLMKNVLTFLSLIMCMNTPLYNQVKRVHSYTLIKISNTI